MRDAAEVRGQNLIVDGDFSTWPTAAWQTGVPNRYNKRNEGNRSYLFISGQGSIWQTVELPLKAAGAGPERPFYHLTFDYKTTGTADTTLTLTFISDDTEQREPVVVALDRTAEWITFEQQVELTPTDQKLCVMFHAGEIMGYLGINVTFVNLQLHLEPLRLAELVLDGVPVLPAETPALRLNHGHDYRLTATPEATSQWYGLQGALAWQSEPPVTQYGIAFNPDLGEQQHLDDAGANWQINCLPYQASHQRGPFTLALVSRYSAEPFLITAELDDFLYKLGEGTIEGMPIITPGIPALLKIRVLADYQEQYPEKRGIAGVEVYWQAGEEAESVTQQSDPDGWSTFAFLPQQAGEYTIYVWVTDKTGEKRDHTFTLTAWQDSPWLDGTILTFDTDTTPVDPRHGKLWLRNGQTHTLYLRRNEQQRDGSFGKVGLRTLENITGMSITPTEKLPLSDQGLSWQITLNNVDSQTVTLRIESDTLSIPLEINAAVVQDNVEQELQALEIDGAPFDPRSELLLFPNTPVTLCCQANAMITELSATLNSQTAPRLKADPPLGALQPLNEGAVCWQLQGSDAAGGDITLTLEVPPLSTPVTLSGRLLPEAIASGIKTVRFDNVDYTSPYTLLMTRDIGHSLQLIPHPLLNGIKVFLTIEADSGLNIQSTPPEDEEVTLNADGVSWTIRGTGTQSGVFMLLINSHWGGEPVVLAVRLLSDKLVDDIDAVKLEEEVIETDDRLLLLTGQSQTLTVIPKGPLVDAALTLQHTSGVSLGVQPVQPQPVAEQGSDWQLMTGSERGEFTLTLNRTGQAAPYFLEGLILSSQLEEEIERITLDHQQLTQLTGLTWQRERTYELRCTPSSGLVGFAIALSNPTHNNISANPSFDTPKPIPADGQLWILDMGSGSRGNFTLALHSSQPQQQPLIFSGVLLSSELSDEVNRINVDPTMTGATYDMDFTTGLVLLAKKYYAVTFTLHSDSLLKDQKVTLAPTDDGAVNPELVLVDPPGEQPLPANIPAMWDVFCNDNQQDRRFTLQLARGKQFAYAFPTRVFTDEKYLTRSGCEFFLAGVKITPGEKHENIERDKDVVLEVKLSPLARPMLASLTFELLSNQQDALTITPQTPIVVTEDTDTLCWTFRHSIAPEERFTLEVTLAGSRILKTIIECLSY
ncbi:hypothetical protein [Enterobacter mori]|uniref:hypothetical protein n=1 Tax=Enterobacter mori TaxID=539813 RepID=UPI001B8CCD2E|nr:hypothetical protein [Enterobacter mori]MBS3049634.1 hypothetical protein [Enterobacter mori]